MGIHTIQVKCDAEIQQDTKSLPYIKDKAVKNSNGTYSYIINPNKFNGEIQKYSEYEFAKDNIISFLEPSNPVITRIDYALNCYEDNFDKLYKLNKVLILLLCIRYNLDNRYGSFDLLTNQKLCSRIQKPRLEVENYNKSIESPDNITKNRLEFRSKQLYKVLVDKELCEFEKWVERINKAVTVQYYDLLQDKCNSFICQKYDAERAKRGFNMKSFIYKNEDFFFTQEQLTKFFGMTKQYKDPNGQARKYKYNNDIEYIPYKVLIQYANIIKRAGEKFFNS